MVCAISSSHTHTVHACCGFSGLQIKAEPGTPPFLSVSIATRIRYFNNAISSTFLCMNVSFCAEKTILPLLLTPHTASYTGPISSSSTYGYCWTPPTCVQSMQWVQFLESCPLLILEIYSLLSLLLPSHSLDYMVLVDMEDIKTLSSSPSHWWCFPSSQRLTSSSQLGLWLLREFSISPVWDSVC